MAVPFSHATRCIYTSSNITGVTNPSGLIARPAVSNSENEHLAAGPGFDLGGSRLDLFQ
jgi:hypothetical protein